MAEFKKTKGPAGVTAPTATPQTQAVVKPDVVNWERYSGTDTGFENVQQSDLGIPFLNILQSKSAEIDRTHKDYATKKIEGAQAGDIINTVTRQVVASVDKDKINVIPAFYEKTYVEWKANRGGLVKVHRDPKILEEVTGKTEKNENILRNGNLLLETASFYVMVDDEQQTQALINMTQTQLKKARLWLNLALGIKIGPARVNPPLFSHIYTLSTVIERKDNNAWYGWNIQVGPSVTSREIVEEAIAIGKRVRIASAPKHAEITNGSDEVPM